MRGHEFARGHRHVGGRFGYDGARHFNFGGSTGSSDSRQSGQTTATARALEPEEKDLLRTQNEILRVELEQIKRQNEALEAIYPGAKDILQGLTTATTKVVDVFGNALQELGVTPTERDIRTASEQQALKTITGAAPLVSDQEQQLIDTIFETERQRGIQDITRLGQEAAAARGLKLTDTPIGSEVVRGVREFSEGLGAEKARTTLAVGQQQQQFREAVRQFQEGLRFQAQQNRLALTGMSPFALNPPISTVTPAQAGQTVASTLAPLTGRPTSSTFFTKGLADWEQSNWGLNILGGVSTVRAKKDILPLDPDEYDAALARLKTTPIVRYRYRWEGQEGRAPHIGPILELSPAEIREDHTRINLLDYIGLNHAGVKALERRVTRLELSE